MHGDDDTETTPQEDNRAVKNVRADDDSAQADEGIGDNAEDSGENEESQDAVANTNPRKGMEENDQATSESRQKPGHGSGRQSHQNRLAGETQRMQHMQARSNERMEADDTAQGAAAAVEESTTQVAPGDALAASLARTNANSAAAAAATAVRVAEKEEAASDTLQGPSHGSRHEPEAKCSQNAAMQERSNERMEAGDTTQGAAAAVEDSGAQVAPGDASLVRTNANIAAAAAATATATSTAETNHARNNDEMERHSSKMRSMGERSQRESLQSNTARIPSTGVASVAPQNESDQMESSLADHPEDEPSAPPVSTAIDESGEMRPGAYSAPGRAFGQFPEWGRPRRWSIVQRVAQSFTRTSIPAQQEISAVLVVEHDEENPSNLPCVEATPMPQENVMHKRLLVGGAVLLLVVGIVVAITVPLTVNSKGQSSAGASGPAPTVSPHPTFAPSQFPSPAPTALVTITVVIQLDEKPEETSWSLKCGEKTLFSVPPRSYDGQKNRRITVPSDVGVGDECLLTISDSGGNGIDNGYYELYYGSDISDASFLFANGSLSFSESMQRSFTVETSPTIAPSVSPAPTAVIPLGAVPITVFIQFDRFPAEIGWSLQCGGIEYFTAEAGTYTIASQNTTETFHVEEGALCQFVIEDRFGDGICCFPQDVRGFYQIYLGEDTGEGSILLVDGDGEFGSEDQVSFTTSLAPTASPAPYCTSLCADESLIDPEFHDITTYDSQGENLTCGEYEATAQMGILSEDDCYHARYVGVKRCGCSPPSHSVCDMCEDGSVPPDPNRDVGLEYTCGQLASISFLENTTEAVCAAVQMVGGVYCGCNSPAASAGACRVCGGTNLIQDAYIGGFSCTALEFYANTQESDVQCSLAQDIGRNALCCGGVPFTPVPTALTASPVPSPMPSTAPTFMPVTCDVGFVSFHLSLTTDGFPEETSWELVGDSGQVLLQGGPYRKLSDIRLQIVESTCLRMEECAVFTIYDSYEDGICCGIPRGTYSLYLDGQEIETSGGEFAGPLESTRIGNCTPTSAPSSMPIS